MGKLSDLAVSSLVAPGGLKTVNGSPLTGQGNIVVQAPLVSGQNIKTVNNQSLVGTGDVAVSGGSGGGFTIDMQQAFVHFVGAQ